jgi:hypothetical protein
LDPQFTPSARSALSKVCESVGTAPLVAQQPNDDPMARYLGPPDLIMGQSQELDLHEKQREAIKSEVQKAQSMFIDWQWDMKEESEKMVRLLQQTRRRGAHPRASGQRDGARAGDQEDAALAADPHPYVLTAEQIAKLDEIRRAGR